MILSFSYGDLIVPSLELDFTVGEIVDPSWYVYTQGDVVLHPRLPTVFRPKWGFLEVLKCVGGNLNKESLSF